MTYRTPDPADETHENVVHEEVTPAPAPVARPAEQVNVNTGGPSYVAPVERSPLVLVRRVVGLVFGVMVALIALRILLLALGANEGNALVDGIYGISEPLVAPFRGVFSLDEVRPTGSSVLDIAALVAIVGWSLIALLIIVILRIPDRA